MKILRIAAFGAAALILLAFLVGSFLPSTWQIERETVIAAPAASVFVELADARALRGWLSGDSANAPRITVGAPPSALVDSVMWSSTRGGMCTLRILDRVVNERAEIELVRADATAHGTITFAPDASSAGTRTRVRWSQRGDVGRNPVMRAFRTLMAARAAQEVDATLARLRVAFERAAH